MRNASLISIFVLVAALIVAGCVGAPQEEKKAEAEKKEIAAPANVTTPAPENKTPVETEKAEEKVTTPEKPPETVVEPVQKVADYLKAHPVATFPGLENRLIEVEFSGTRSVLRFRTGTPNPRQEAIYLLGVQFLVFPEIKSANTTGYNPDGKIILSPDSRTQETRSTYWKKYRTQTEWFPNLVLEPECKVDTDCNDKDDCTKDLCTSDGFCSNARIVKAGCTA